MRKETLLLETAKNRYFGFIKTGLKPLSGPITQANAKEFAMRLGVYDIVANRGWLQRWLKDTVFLLNVYREKFVL